MYSLWVVSVENILRYGTLSCSSNKKWHKHCRLLKGLENVPIQNPNVDGTNCVSA